MTRSIYLQLLMFIACLGFAAGALAQEQPAQAPLAEPATTPPPEPAAAMVAPTPVAGSAADGVIASDAAPAPQTNAGPAVTLPSEDTRTPDSRAAVETAAAANTHVGGYAELHYNAENVTGPGTSASTIDLHRFVFFIGHEFTPELRFYSEVEIEHAVASSEDVGEVEIEQAYLDYKLVDDQLVLRAGLLLLPMGITNQVHEPPVFHGVERTMVDTVVIPTTWREGGVGILGTPIEGLRYQLYVTSTLSPEGFTADQGVRDGHGELAEAPAKGFALSARVEYEPTLGVVAGLSGYYGLTGENAELVDKTGADLELGVPVLGIVADARVKREGFEARGELAYFHVGDTAGLRRAADDKGQLLGIDVGSGIFGAYAEVAYDLLHFANVGEHQLLPFVRLERYDTLFQISGRKHTAADDKLGVTSVAFGLTYRPIEQIAFKSDFILANPDGDGPGGRSDASGRFDLGLGLMY